MNVENPIVRLAKLTGLRKRNTFGDRIIIEDEVLVYQGKKLLFKSKGHIVNQGLIGLVNYCSCFSVSSTPTVLSDGWTAKTNTRMRLGTDLTTPTGGGTTALAAEITTSPNTQSGETSNPSANTYRISWIATWNAGTISGTIGEMGLFLYFLTSLQAFGTTGLGATAFQLFSRLSKADGDFTEFTINVTVPLTIEWRLTLTFA